MLFLPHICLLVHLITGLVAEKYEGFFLGKLNTYAHQVTGDVYVIDEYTFLIKNFHYDGLAQDAFFWAGATVRPSNIGFIVPDEKGRSNKLRRYINQDITLKIPDDKKINSLKWFSIWDIRDNRNFADIYIPEGFESPSPKKISEFSQGSHNVKSAQVIVLNSKTIKVPDFSYDGRGDQVFFFVGTGPQPNPSGKKIANEIGYLESLGSYESETIILTLPGDMTIFEMDWLAVWDEANQESYGYVSIPEGLNIPPSLAVAKKRESRLPNCEQLHRKLQLNWEIFGPTITFEAAAEIGPDDYVAFGISGSRNSSKMIGADVAISYISGHLGFTSDYNITDLYPCTNINGYYKGVCPDDRVGGIENYQILTFFREDGISRLTFRRSLIATDEGDYSFSKEEPTYIVWAIGRMNKLKEPRIHTIYPKKDVRIHFGRKPEKNCFPFSQINPDLETSEDSLLPHTHVNDKSWGPLKIVNQSLTTFYARLGVPGGERGYSKSTDDQSSPGLVWYINGLMAPVLFVRRGVTYHFRIEGGNNPSDAYAYHPLYITSDSQGGYSKYKDEEKKKIHVYAGIEYDRRGRPSPTAAGRLCLWSYPDHFDPRKADTRFVTFLQFRNSLNYSCSRGSPALLNWTPNASTPDLVYYQSYTQRNMGWKIVVLDDFASTAAASAAVTVSSSSSASSPVNVTHTHTSWQKLSFLLMVLIFSSLLHNLNR